MAIYQLLRESEFDPDHVNAMAQAFEAVCLSLKVSQSDKAARETVAHRIVAHGKRGERNPERLFKAVIAEMERR